jgi:large subunit ribosomal protein L32
MAKHPVPKKKTSRARGNRRYKSFKNKAQKRLKQAIQLTKCDNCGSDVRTHHMCANCGFYRGKDRMAEVPVFIGKDGKAVKSETKPVEEKEEVTTIKAE